MAADGGPLYDKAAAIGDTLKGTRCTAEKLRQAKKYKAYHNSEVFFLYSGSYFQTPFDLQKYTGYTICFHSPPRYNVGSVENI